MINAATLLKDLKALLSGLEDDIRARLEEIPEERARLEGEYREARDGGRTGAAWEAWRDERVTQAAAAWVLAGVFVRFLEDNGLIDQPWLSGPDQRRRLAEDRHTLYFRSHPSHSDRDYLLHVFGDVAKYPAVGALFDKRFNPLWGMVPSGDGAAGLLKFWQAIDPATGALIHDFTDPDWNTRFLGDLYQDLSENIRKQYALLQTPEFVESFILDRTLTPAIQEFGFETVRLIDPTCGSGHFLLGAFERLFALWQQKEPGTNGRALVQRALGGVWGVDLNPYAVAIARFRLLVAAFRACGITRLADAPGFVLHLAAGDSLLHGPRFRGGGMLQMTIDPKDDPLHHVYETEDREALRAILGQQYHAVVGNPPYITPKDAVLNQAYRIRFDSCHMKYSLGVPFTERFFDLALQGRNGQPAGFVGMITANSFMKREFGKKLIETFFRLVDLETVIDTSGAYIPGHGTPTVILFGRHRQPVLSVVRTVQGIRGEPSTPEDASQGLVWSSIVAMIDQPGAENEFISVVDTSRGTFQTHPWSLGGGGAAELKEAIEQEAQVSLGTQIESIGFMAISGDDEAFVAPRHYWRRWIAPSMEFGVGDLVRDWSFSPEEQIVFPYQHTDGQDISPVPLEDIGTLASGLWPLRTNLKNRLMFGKLPHESGIEWFEYRFFAKERFLSPLSIAFAEIASHNHFVLDRGGKVFNQTAPVIKLPAEATEADYLALLGLLNSSTACFWMKQVCHQKQMMGGDGIRISDKSKVPYQFNGTALKKMPVPGGLNEAESRKKVLVVLAEMESLGSMTAQHTPAIAIRKAVQEQTPIMSLWERYASDRENWHQRMVFLQEELDWIIYYLFGLTNKLVGFDQTPVEIGIQPGYRPFELTAGTSRDGHKIPTEIPCSWPDKMRDIWQQRIRLVQENNQIRIIEDPHYKRRWIGRQGLFNHNHNKDELKIACEEWLLDRLEAMPLWKSDAPELTTCARLADQLHHDDDFLKVAALYRGRSDFDLTQLVTELVEAESVPFLPLLRYKESGLRKRAAWERTWDLQRREDAGEKVGDIPAPPKYESADFANATWWRLRGKLDVPKERFVLYPHCQRQADPTPVIAWAGWNHLLQAQALAGYFIAMKEREGWSSERLTPLLAGLLELSPWLNQWHNALDPVFGTGMGDYFAGFIDEQMRGLELTIDKVRSWNPPQAARRRGGKKA